MATSALPGCMPQLPSQAQRSSLWRFRRGGWSFEEAFAAAELDEIYQRGKWGEDAEALRLSRKKEVELIEIAHFLDFVCGGQ
jgi:predicted fused transcriptional regulator/phosphomethylpyrimidine kinase